MLNEKFYVVRVLVLLLALLGVVTSVKADYIDLTKGGVQATPWMRCDEDKPLVCVIVKHEGKDYLVVHDSKGEYKIFIIENDEPKLIWARDMV